MRSLDDIRAVFQLKAEGMTDREVSDSTGVPINTIRAWRNRGLPERAAPRLTADALCPDCGCEAHDFESLPQEAYSYLLGVYLGDGCLAGGSGTWSLRIALDDAYPGIIGSCCDAIEATRGRRPNPRPDCRGQHVVRVDSGWKQWRCLFPQHSRGKKHLRKIELLPWQQKIVDAQPEAFLRGLIHTDGWRGLNRVHVKGKDYQYPRYQFSNRSDDIRRLFTDTCDNLGIKWRRWTRFHISVAQRQSVALMDTFIGPKS